MELTGERVIPNKMNPNNGMLIEHKARYKFASYYTQGRVLDLACGVGYGAEILLSMGEGIEEIIGVDIDQESIGYAKKHYDYPWTNFLLGQATDKKLVDKIGCFDSIVSMETIEHIKSDFEFIDNLKRLLKQNGTLIISTPFGRGREVECSNPYHYRQYTEYEFRELLKPFSEVEMFYQLNEQIEKRKEEKKYYLMVAVCKK